jgi:hypothetical protein
VWSISGSVVKTTSGTPQGTRHARITNDGYIVRTVDLSGVEGADLEYSIKRSSGVSGSGDRLYVEVSSDGTNWTTVAWYTDSGTGSSDPFSTSYNSMSEALPSSMEDEPAVYVRFRTEIGSSDLVYIDSIQISVGTANGYLDGNDGSSPTTCVSQNPTPRERQLDVRTLELGRAIKSQDVEVFVVAFSGGVPGCNLDSTQVFNDEDPTQCNTVIDSTAGPIGDTTGEDSANHRLLKCIASNTNGTNDHYFYASDEDELTGIFTAIANQIAHRLLE